MQQGKTFAKMPSKIVRLKGKQKFKKYKNEKEKFHQSNCEPTKMKAKKGIAFHFQSKIRSARSQTEVPDNPHKLLSPYLQTTAAIFLIKFVSVLKICV